MASKLKSGSFRESDLGVGNDPIGAPATSTKRPLSAETPPPSISVAVGEVLDLTSNFATEPEENDLQKHSILIFDPAEKMIGLVDGARNTNKWTPLSVLFNEATSGAVLIWVTAGGVAQPQIVSFPAVTETDAGAPTGGVKDEPLDDSIARDEKNQFLFFFLFLFFWFFFFFPLSLCRVSGLFLFRQPYVVWSRMAHRSHR